jgi:protein TonB
MGGIFAVQSHSGFSAIAHYKNRLRIIHGHTIFAACGKPGAAVSRLLRRCSVKRHRGCRYAELPAAAQICFGQSAQAAETELSPASCVYIAVFIKKACRKHYYLYNDNHSHLAEALVMALAYRQAQIHNNWKGSIGAAFTVAIHAVVIAILLLARNHVSSEAVPMAVAILSEAPQPNKEQPVVQRPVLSTNVATLHVPQPEILLADNAPSNAIAVSTSAPSSNTAKVQPAPTQPRFDADYLNNPAPRYPALSRRLREEGVVMLRVYVLPNGLPDTVELKRSSGSARLDESALMAVRQWRFLPARSGDVAVAAWVVVPIAFSLAA